MLWVLIEKYQISLTYKCNIHYICYILCIYAYMQYYIICMISFVIQQISVYTSYICSHRWRENLAKFVFIHLYSLHFSETKSHLVQAGLVLLLILLLSFLKCWDYKHGPPNRALVYNSKQIGKLTSKRKAGINKYTRTIQSAKSTRHSLEENFPKHLLVLQWWFNTLFWYSRLVIAT